MKNLSILIRYKFNYNLFNKIIFFNNKRKNIFLNKIIIKNNYIYNFKIKKNMFLLNKYLMYKLSFICGGDGSIINLFKNFFNLNFFLKCYNFGNLGFLSNNFEKKNFIIKKLVGNVLIFHKFNYSLIFVNEILIKKISCKIFIKNNIFLSDGIMITSSLGSTGYNFSLNKIHFNAFYFLISFILQHNNKKKIFFSKKIKIKLKKNFSIFIDSSLKIFLEKNSFLIVNYFKKKTFLINKKLKFYDK